TGRVSLAGKYFLPKRVTFGQLRACLAAQCVPANVAHLRTADPAQAIADGVDTAFGFPQRTFSVQIIGHGFRDEKFAGPAPADFVPIPLCIGVEETAWHARLVF